MKFVLFVEGETERAVIADFLRRWLNQRLSARVGVNAICLRGSPNFVRKIGTKARFVLDGPDSGAIIAGIGLLDLYGFPHYPGHVKSAAERYEWAKQEVEGAVGHFKFRMYFTVHETEAWLLSQPGIFPPDIQKPLQGMAKNPEDVDFDNPPAKRLDDLYKRFCGGYRKVVHGTDLFRKLDPEIARKKCPHLDRMLNDMLELARGAGL